ncbi:MAG: histidinol-phosphate aminotransferase family protein [Dehalococcoidia bacterium]|nr:histidinol-phosphate aminotransferase family protein [Dehalococcoidia bacterium]
MGLRINPHIHSLPLIEHGGTGYAGLKMSGVLDFSTCCNPYGPPKEVYRALRAINIRDYPDPHSGELVTALASSLGTAADRIIAGSGSTEIIRLAALACLAAGDKAVIPSPTYGEYELAAGIAGATVVKHILNEDADFRLDLDELASVARKHNPGAVFLCNPNNPTGQLLPQQDLRGFAGNLPDTLVILDEAYMAFTDETPGGPDLTDEPNVLIVRSLTKDFALAGLRLGYGLASPSVINILKKVRPPWNVSSPAQRAGVAAIACGGYVRRCNSRMQRCRAYLTRRLSGMGYRIIPTDTHFFLVRVGDAAGFKRLLLGKGFLVRDCASFGLPSYVRISPRSMQDCRKLVQAIAGTAWKLD